MCIKNMEVLGPVALLTDKYRFYDRRSQII